MGEILNILGLRHVLILHVFPWLDSKTLAKCRLVDYSFNEAIMSFSTLKKIWLMGLFENKMKITNLKDGDIVSLIDDWYMMILVGSNRIWYSQTLFHRPSSLPFLTVLCENGTATTSVDYTVWNCVSTFNRGNIFEETGLIDMETHLATKQNSLLLEAIASHIMNDTSYIYKGSFNTVIVEFSSDTKFL